MKTRFISCGLMLLSTLTHGVVTAAPLTESTFTEVVHDVSVVDYSTKNSTSAKLNELFKAPNLVRTGPDSRAELTAPDKTITRVGANTVFAFESSGREIDLKQGSILFQSPTGKGGGVIKSGGASAAVLGTTLIVATAPDHKGFKVILLEGKGKVSLGGGRTRTLTAGQMIYVLPGRADFGPMLDIHLSKLVNGSGLVKGFAQPLPSIPKIEAAVQHQEVVIESGRAADTGVAADSVLSQPTSTSGPSTFDSTTLKTGATHALIVNETPPGVAGGNPVVIFGPKGPPSHSD